MSVSVLVRTFTGNILQSTTVPLVKEMCTLAREMDLPLLGGVDPYDNTIFNGLQVAGVQRELQTLRLRGPEEFEEVIDEINRLIGLVTQKPHRYLVFNGD